MRAARPSTFPAALSLVAALSMSSPAWATPTVEEAHQRLEDWQLEEAIAIAQKHLLEDPDDPAVWNLVAHVLHQRGEHETALAMFDAAREAGFETDYVHLLAMSSAAYAAHFSSLETEHFSIRYLNKDEVVAHYAAPVLEAAYTNIGGALGLLPAERDEKIVVEIYPDARGLAGATGLTIKEIATSGTIAVCKFHRLMITSPLATAGGYDWADTLAHELTHLIISKKSNNNIPIWLHEGIAKYYESLWKGDAGEALGAYGEKLLADAVKKRKYITYQEMHPSMAKLPSQEDAALAFAEVFTTIEFMVERFGKASVPEVLALTGEGLSLERAFKRVFKLDLGGIESAWRRYVQKREFRIVPGAAPERITFAEDGKEGAGEKPLEEMKDREVHDFSRLGELLQLRGHHHAAVLEYEKAYAKAGLKYPTLVYRLARAYRDTARIDEALALLAKELDVHPGNGDASLLAGRIRLKQGQVAEAKKHFEAARLQNPFNPHIHAALAELYRVEGREDDAKKEDHFLKLTTKPRPSRSYELPSPPAGSARLTIITAAWSRVRLDGGLPVATPLWHHPVDAGPHSIEYFDQSGAVKVQEIALEAGESKRVVLD